MEVAGRSCDRARMPPFVIPRILGQDAARAVISSVRLGRHRALPICYFGDPYPFDSDLVDEWATSNRTHVRQRFRRGTSIGA